MKKWLTLLPALMLTAALMVGCGGEDEAENGSDGENASNNTSVDANEVSHPEMCACGHEKGGEACCAEDATVCTECGFHAESALCCTGVESIAEGSFCACGYEKGTENCCAEGATACEKCGYNEGSTLCCKIKPADDQ